eukprot:1195231-Prorocentrum_minimum.AAC.1
MGWIHEQSGVVDARADGVNSSADGVDSHATEVDLPAVEWGSGCARPSPPRAPHAPPGGGGFTLGGGGFTLGGGGFTLGGGGRVCCRRFFSDVPPADALVFGDGYVEVRAACLAELVAPVVCACVPVTAPAPSVATAI